MGAQAAATELAGRFVRSRDAHGVRRVADVDRDARPRARRRPGRPTVPYFQGTVLCRARARPVGPDASAARGGSASRSRARSGRRRWWRRCADRQGLPIVKPPVQPHQGDRSRQRRDPLAGAARRDAGHHPQPSGAAGAEHPPLGRPGNNVGTLVTKTLVIAGERNFGPTPNGQRGAMLRAYDKATGQEVGAVYMPAPQSGSPMTYMVGGRRSSWSPSAAPATAASCSRSSCLRSSD